MSDYAGLSDAELMRRLASTQASGGPAVPPPEPVTVTPQPPLSPGLASETGYNVGFDPAKMTDAQLQRAAADADPRMSTLEDVGRSMLGGAQNVAAGMATGPRGLSDLTHALVQGGSDFLSRHGLDHMSIPQVGHIPGAPDIPNVGELVQGLVGAGAHAAGIDPHLAQMTAGAFNPYLAMGGSGTQQGAVALNGGLPIHLPQTPQGRYAQRIVEMAPMAAQPGSAPTRLASMLASGVGSQAAEDMAPDQYKGAAALAGALTGGAGVAAVTKAVQAPQAALGNALGDISQEQIAAAQALRQQAAARGLQITLPEAVQQVTNGGTGLGRMQRVIEGTKQGGAMTAPYFAKRPGQVSDAVRALADTIAPPSEQPGVIGQRAQGAATTALDRARQVVNAAAGPDYAALPSQTMDPEAYAALSANPSYKVALDALRSHPELGAEVAGLPDNSLAVVNEVKKRLGIGAEQAAGTPLLPGDNHLAAVRTGAKALADQLARQTSPEYAAANDTVHDLSQQYVEPLKAGPLGKISKTDQIGGQTQALYPAQPPEGAATETGQAVRVLGATEPGIAEDLTRQHLVNTLNNAMKDLQGGQNQYAGAKYAVALAGHPEQAAALRAGLEALPGGVEHSGNMDELLQALRATGKRQPPGSMTAFNESDLKDFHISPAISAMRSFNIAEPLEPISKALEGLNYRRNVKSLAEMIMADPEDTAAVLQAAQKAGAKRGVSSLLPAMLQAKGRKK